MGAGLAELASRYRDSLRVLRKRPGLAYASLNGAVAAVAYYALRVFGVDLGGGNPTKNGLLLICAASFGGMALLQSSFFNVRLGDETVSVGPNAAIQVLLKTVDRKVDRYRAQERVKKAVAVAAKLDFQKAFVPLPMVTSALLQNLDPADADKFAAAVKGIQASPVDDRFKLILLCLQLMGLVGEEVLDKAVDDLGDLVGNPKAKP